MTASLYSQVRNEPFDMWCIISKDGKAIKMQQQLHSDITIYILESLQSDVKSESKKIRHYQKLKTIEIPQFFINPYAV